MRARGRGIRAGRVVAVAVMGALLGAGCGDDGGRLVRDEDLDVGTYRVHVTVDEAGLVCTRAKGVDRACLGTDSEGAVQSAVLMAADSGGYLLTIVAEPATRIEEFQGAQSRIDVDQDSTVIVAESFTSPTCLRYFDEQGRRVSLVVQGAVQVGSTETAVGSTEVCGGEA